MSAIDSAKQLSLSVALLCRMTPWKSHKHNGVVYVNTPSGMIFFEYDKDDAEMFESIPEADAVPIDSGTNRERIIQIVKKIDLFNGQLGVRK